MGSVEITTRPGRAVRRAGVADAAALVRLRAQMLTDMGMTAGGDGPHWRDSAGAWFTQRLSDGHDFAAFVRRYAMRST